MVAVNNQLKRLLAQAWMVLLLCVFIVPMQAQTSILHHEERNATREGNKLYDKENYTDAEVAYKKALDKKNNMPEATFNLGDAMYKQKRYDEAIKQFELTAKTNPDPKVKANAWHNTGNAYLEQKKWEDAVKSYKEALKINPADKDTKYNLAYANTMIRKDKNDQKNNKDKKDKDKDKDKNKKDDQQQQQQQNKKPDDKEDDKQGGNQQQNQGKDQQKSGGQMTRDQAEKLLQAAQNEEQKTNQKIQQKQVKATNVKVQKDW